MAGAGAASAAPATVEVVLDLVVLVFFVVARSCCRTRKTELKRQHSGRHKFAGHPAYAPGCARGAPSLKAGFPGADALKHVDDYVEASGSW